jgi:hypothetical protein
MSPRNPPRLCERLDSDTRSPVSTEKSRKPSLSFGRSRVRRNSRTARWLTAPTASRTPSLRLTPRAYPTLRMSASHPTLSRPTPSRPTRLQPPRPRLQRLAWSLPQPRPPFLVQAVCRTRTGLPLALPPHSHLTDRPLPHPATRLATPSRAWAHPRRRLHRERAARPRRRPLRLARAHQ